MSNRGLQPGQHVWVIHLRLEDNALKPKPVPRASITEKEFYHVVENYLGKFGEHWVIGPVGKSQETPPYGMAYRPERVYLTRQAAKAALAARIDSMISQLETLKATL